jgi:hypothetical protein
VPVSAKSLVIACVVAVVVLALVWSIVRDKGSEPYTVDAATLKGWKIVLGQPADPWVVAVEPPAALTASLFKQVSQKIGQPLVAPPHSALPLVMRKEHDEALQGVYGSVDIRRMADGEIDGTTTFQPVCIGHRVASSSSSPGELFFLAFNSPEFNHLRLELQPDFPEHAGTGVYDPGALTPILPIAMTTTEFERWWPIVLDPNIDCQAQVLAK